MSTDPHLIPPSAGPDPGSSPDPRPEETRRAIVHSFNGMVLERPYQQISVSEIVGSAGVGRSTFYEHFRGKDDVFRQSVSGVLGVLADSVVPHAEPQPLQAMLEHFRENRAACLGMLESPTAFTLSAHLADTVRDRLAGLAHSQGLRLSLPLELVASQVASAQLALVRQWLAGPSPCESSQLATAMIRSAQAIVNACTAP